MLRVRTALLVLVVLLSLVSVASAAAHPPNAVSARAGVSDLSLIGSPWPMRGHDAQHTGRSPYRGAQTGSIVWTRATDGWVQSSPAIGPDGTVYIGSVVDIGNRGSIYALDPSDGSVKWTRSTDGWVESSPAIGSDGTVYVGSDDCKIYALDSIDGSVKWTRTTDGYVSASPAIGSDGTVYVSSDRDKFYALNPTDGSVKWISAGRAGGFYGPSSPAIGPDGTIYVGVGAASIWGDGSGAFYALNPADGSVEWAVSTDPGVYSSPAVGSDGTVYFGTGDLMDGTYAVGSAYALNPADGSVKWRRYTGSSFYSSPAIGSDGTIYIGCLDGKVYALNPADGSIKWSRTTGDPVYSSPAIGSDGTIYVGSDALNPADGSIKWSRTTPGSGYSSPAIGSDGNVYIGSDDGKVYALGSAAVLPKATVYTPVAPSTMYHTRSYTVYGYLKPRHTAGSYPVRIYKYRYVSGTWKSYGYVKAKASNYSSYTKCSVSVKLPYTGKWKVRAYAPADSGHVATWSSGYDYVTVK